MPRVLLTEAGYAAALGNYVSVPQVDAVAVAKLERDALRMRAAQGGPCARRWRYASRIADRIVTKLERGAGSSAVPDMYALGRAWRAAATCSGAPSPLSDDGDVETLHVKLDELRRRHDALYRWTRIGTYATIAGVLVAAARLGVISIPFIKARRRR